MSDPFGRQADEILAPYGPPVPSLLPWAARWAPRHDLFMIAETAAGQVASTPSARWPAVADAVAEVLAERAGADPELIATLPRVLPSVAAHFDPAQLEILLAGPASTDALCYARLGHPGSRLLEEHQRRPAGADWTAILSARRPGGADPLPPLANFRLLTQLAREPGRPLAQGPDLVYLFPFQRPQRQAGRLGDLAVAEIEEYIPTRVPWYAAALCARVAPFLGDAQRFRMVGDASAASTGRWAQHLFDLARSADQPWPSATAEIDASHPAVRGLNELAAWAEPAELASASAQVARSLFERFGGPRPEQQEPGHPGRPRRLLRAG